MYRIWVSGFGAVYVEYRYDEYRGLRGTSDPDNKSGRRVGQNHCTGGERSREFAEYTRRIAAKGVHDTSFGRYTF